MADTKRKAGTAQTCATTALNSLANAARVLCTEYDNSTNLLIEADFELLAGFASAPTAGNAINLYLVPCLDGTNYGSGDSTDAAQPSTMVGTFSVYASTSGKRLNVSGVRIPPCKFKMLLENQSGQALASSGNILYMLPSHYAVA
jgi:hypothetical protein